MNEESAPLGRTFYLLLLAFLLSATAVNVGRLGTSLSMQSFNFSPSAVASTATVSGLVAIPVTILIGALADRLGHKRLLVVGCLLPAGGVLTLVTAAQRATETTRTILKLGQPPSLPGIGGFRRTQSTKTIVGTVYRYG